MENAMLWVTIVGIIVLPLIGWLINTLITKKIDTLEKNQEEDRELFFKKFDELKDSFVRKDIYDQAMTFHQKEVDSKFTNLIETMSNNFKNVESDIKEVKDLINEKFKIKNAGG